ncbi:nucleotide exchange factor GrpE [Catenovulum sp. SM1970]|uniref:nucleotide exchange factor GrpE n=1 Tax=Marinifaba aquimaris TaxID=2741323 RepID=UPI0015743114|nr:nucleotide exchange factor GrpE [Marinifaba aquimaris]NTS77560.1 nucleotide exchange factor GrpE [Marinifaba aquimaris]
MSNEQNDVQVEEQSVEQAEQVEAAEGEVLSPEQAQIEELTAKLAAAEKTVADQQDSVVRAKAEIDNVRRRTAREAESTISRAIEKFSADILPVVDNLERAIESANKEEEAIKPVVEGVELTLKSFVDALEKQGIKQLNPEGEAFNPEFHQAMSMVPNPDVAPNTVIAVMQKGYELNGRLLRPAMVMVSQAAKVDTQA